MTTDPATNGGERAEVAVKGVNPGSAGTSGFDTTAEYKFDASLLKPGENQMTFTDPAGDVATGVVWDCLRLELNDGSTAYPAPPDNQRPDYPTVPQVYL